MEAIELERETAERGAEAAVGEHLRLGCRAQPAGPKTRWVSLYQEKSRNQ